MGQRFRIIFLFLPFFFFFFLSLFVQGLNDLSCVCLVWEMISSGSRGGRRPVRIPSRPIPKKPKIEEVSPLANESDSSASKKPEEVEEHKPEEPKPKAKRIQVEEPKVKRPRPPVRNRSSFMFFFAAKNDEVADEYPHSNAAERLTVIGEMWRSLSRDERMVCVFYIVCTCYSHFKYHGALLLLC